MPQSLARSAPAAPSTPHDSSSFPAVAAPLARRTGSRRLRANLRSLSAVAIVAGAVVGRRRRSRAGRRQALACGHVGERSLRAVRVGSRAALRHSDILDHRCHAGGKSRRRARRLAQRCDGPDADHARHLVRLAVAIRPRRRSIRSARQHPRGRGVSSRAARPLRRGRLPRGLQCRSLDAMRTTLRPAVRCRPRREPMSPRSRRCCTTADRRRATSSPRSSAPGPVRRCFRCGERRFDGTAARHRMAWRNATDCNVGCRIGRALRHSPRACSRACRHVGPGYELPSVSSGSGGQSDRFGCGCGGAETTNPRTAREKAGLRRGVCGWED